MKIKNEGTFLHDMTTGINLFLGAGFSVDSFDMQGRPLPIGNTLKDEALIAFELEKFNELTLPKLSRILENNTKRDAWHDYLTNRFKISKFDDYYYNLDRINLGTIFTTNIDNLIYEIVSKSDRYYVNDVLSNGPMQNDRRAIQYLPLHGCVLNPEKQYIFSDEGLSTAFRNDPDKWHMLTEAIQKMPTLFIGYGMNDSGVLEALAEDTIRGRSKKNLWLLAHDDSTFDYFEAIGFNTIKGNTKELFAWIENNLELKIVQSSTPNFDYTGLEREKAPDKNTVPSLPLPDFFLGGEPHWCYIYNNSLYELSVGKDIINRIYSKDYKNQIVLGMAFSGKTTLMMQIVQRLEYSGLKLIAAPLTVEYVKYLIKKIAGRKAVVFVDNFTNDIIAYNLLASQNNIKVIGFSRDYNYEIVSHRIDPVDNNNAIDITEINEIDCTNLFMNIPTNMRTYSIKMPERLSDCSVFEFIQNNINTKKIREKLIVLYKDLKKNYPLHLHCVLFCCYIYECGTPVSFDMLMAFLRDRIDNYVDIFDIMRAIKNMIKDHDLTFDVDDSNQDFYRARSRVFSDSFMRIANVSDLNTMLNSFINNVSPVRIHEYKTFKRKGYDAKLFAKAFPAPQAGKEIYERLLYLDDSSYMRQQYALYLSKVCDFQNAFRVIEEAKNMARYNIFSINNSYAVILYDANKNLNSEEPKVKDALEESLNVLMTCYSKDKRKLFHAIRFAQYSMDYYYKYPHIDDAAEYLRTAQNWLEDEMKSSSWSYELKNTKRDLDKLINII